jgi:dephospho-CoA kinase
MIKIGITGEMGSGKTYCSKIFGQLGIPIFYSDDISKKIVNSDQELKKEICIEFGNIYDEDGIIIPKLLRDIVFVPGGEPRLKRLNEIIHPYVFNEFELFCSENSRKKYVLAESALIYESNMRSFVDQVIYVCVDEQTRIKRTFERSGYTEQEYKQRMKTQINSETKKKLSDFIIYNNDGDNLNEQILNIHNHFVYS